MEETKNLLNGEENEEEEEEQAPSEGQTEVEEEVEEEEENDGYYNWQWEQDRRYEEWRSLPPYRVALIIIIPVFLGTLLFLRASGSTRGEMIQSPAAPTVAAASPPHQPESSISLTAWALTPLTTFVERDRALREISANPWTASLSPELAYAAQQQRLFPIWALGGAGSNSLTAGGTSYSSRCRRRHGHCIDGT